MKPTIRSIEPRDRQDWQRLWAAYLEFYKSDLADGYDALWLRLMNPNEDGTFALLACDADGKAVGLVQFLFHQTTWSGKKRCYLNDLYADPESRGQGIGRALIEAVYAVADERGHPDVYWLTQEFNATARTLYYRIAKVTPFIKYAR